MQQIQLDVKLLKRKETKSSRGGLLLAYLLMSIVVAVQAFFFRFQHRKGAFCRFSTEREEKKSFLNLHAASFYNHPH